ncbi:MAG: hypothetical protein WDW36_009517 [Sanguina aurantia]
MISGTGSQQQASTQAVEFFVAGRVCLFGEHSDWAGQHRGANLGLVPGRTIVVGTEQGLTATATRCQDKVLTITTTSHDGEAFGPEEFPLQPEALLAVARAGGFWSYVAGTAYRLLTSHHVGGIVIHNHTTTLPHGKGLSSSAAVCVMVARAFNLVYDLKLTTRGEMEFAYLGEITTPSKCGRMDQACAFGSVPVVLTFDGDMMQVHPAKLAAPLLLVLVDLNAAKDTTEILNSLQAAYPYPSTDQHHRLHALLGTGNRSIVEAALGAMAEGNMQALGLLMTEAQLAFDAAAGPLCPAQLAAPLLHTVLALPSLQRHLWGGKGVGSQGDGTVQLLCRSVEDQTKVCALLLQELGMACVPMTVQPTDTL